MKITLYAADFDAIMKACKNSIIQNNSREILKRIQFYSDGKRCWATALNGMTSITLSVPVAAQDEEATICIPVMKVVGRKAKVVVIEKDGGKITVTAGFESTVFPEISDSDRDFPDHRQFYPRGSAQAEMYFNSDRLRDIFANLPANITLKLSFRGGKIPLVIESSPESQNTLKALIMPVRPKNEW